MKKKAIPVVIALALIVIIGAAALGKAWLDKYSYSKERVDLDAFYQVTGEQRAIILQNETVEDRAVVRDGVCYLSLPFIRQYLNEIFYTNPEENLLLYTTATGTTRVNFGESAYSIGEESTDMGYPIVYQENGVVYVAADFVKLYTNFSYDIYDRRIQIYTRWGSRDTAVIARDTAVRERGGVKSAILRDVEQGETVEILEEMETWSKVKTSDSVIGYVENKRLTDRTTVEDTPVTDYVAPEYTSRQMDGGVCLGWHAIGGVAGNDTMESVLAETVGINVIAPTWFSLNDNEGNFRSYASADYVQRAHDRGLQVWGVLDDFNYNNETGGGIDVLGILSSTEKRQRLTQGIVDQALQLGLDGINLDFERIDGESGTHYVQFLRELSVLCRSSGLVLSIDNYVPFQFNDYYRLDVQGEIADYVIIMGYDEHWHGSGDPGSVASIDYVSNGLDRTLEEVPVEKIVNALPLYTILWKTDGGTVTDTYLTVANTADFMSHVSAEPVWDETTCQNYAEWTEGTATYQIWLEDEESISVKLNVMRTKNIGGVAVWRLGYGTPEIWQLLNAFVNS